MSATTDLSASDPRRWEPVATTDPTPTTTPADKPRGPFARLSPEWRALIVLVVGAAFSVGWQKLFPGTPVPQLPPTVTVVYGPPILHDAPQK